MVNASGFSNMGIKDNQLLTFAGEYSFRNPFNNSSFFISISIIFSVLLVALFSISLLPQAEAVLSVSFEFGTFGGSPGDLSFPPGVATDSNDRIIVSDTLHRIQVFDSTGAFQFGFGSFGTGPLQFDTPEGIAINTTDAIIVADTFNDRIKVYDSTGIFAIVMVANQSLF